MGALDALLREPRRQLLETGGGVGEDFVAELTPRLDEAGVELQLRDVDAEGWKTHQLLLGSRRPTSLDHASSTHSERLQILSGLCGARGMWRRELISAADSCV